MGIYDRDYYRKEGPSFLGSFSDRGSACKWLIGINVAVFVVQLLTWNREAGGSIIDQAFALDVSRVLHGELWRLLSYAFLHSVYDPFHILFNMLFLWWFGNEIENLYGSRE